MNPRVLVVACAAMYGALASAGCSSADAPPGPECTGETNDALRVCSQGPLQKGLDVSVYQGTVDWDAVKGDGYTFAFARVSDGLHHLDTQFANNWAGMQAAGVVRGAYQFFRPGLDPDDQADLFVQKIADNGGLLPGDLPPVLDLETVDGVSNATLVARAKTWLAHVEQATGRKPLVYTAAFMSTNIGTNFAGYPLWVANYGASCPSMPSGWSEWTFWQTADDGQVAGINAGGTDMDVFQGSLADLLAFAETPSPDAGAPDSGDADTSTADAGSTPPGDTAHRPAGSAPSFGAVPPGPNGASPGSPGSMGATLGSSSPRPDPSQVIHSPCQ